LLSVSQVLQEIGQKKAFAEQQLLIVRQQKVANSRENRMLQLTASEVESLPKDTKVYEGVGKMCALDCICLLHSR
jgi:prefoldin subunit 1